jgi:transposase
LIIPNINQKLSEQKIIINHDVIEKEVRYSGWLIILSNKQLDIKTVIDYYRSKDVVEKSFERFKERLDMRRIRVHSPKNMESKIFIAFIANIILSHIDTVMHNNSLYTRYTLKGLLKNLNAITLKIIKNNNFLAEMTCAQKEIFNFFGIPVPTRDCRI